MASHDSRVFSQNLIRIDEEELLGAFGLDEPVLEPVYGSRESDFGPRYLLKDSRYNTIGSAYLERNPEWNGSNNEPEYINRKYMYLVHKDYMYRVYAFRGAQREAEEGSSPR